MKLYICEEFLKTHIVGLVFSWDHFNFWPRKQIKISLVGLMLVLG